MSVSIIAGLLIVWQVMAGFARGGIRAVANLAGVLGALLLSPAFSAPFQPLIFNYVTQNPFWERSLAIMLAAVCIWLVCFVLGRLVHRSVGGSQEGFWTFGLNKKIGLFIGFLEGMVLAFVFLWLVYILGSASWLFLPVAQGKGRAAPPEGTLASFLVNAKEDLAHSPVGGAITALDEQLGVVPSKVYQAAALINALADQPDARKRLAEYPGFQRLLRVKSILEAASDPELNKLAADGQRPVSYIVLHRKTLALWRDKEAREALAEFDYADALKFVARRERPAPKR
ncbi:MAG: CvpA family protein [Verrucomicrobia bacterium]|nr:CvpA family protein [Verrucomicrobiota bacterium]